MIQHDRLFKELLTTHFLEFLELFLPELAALIEPGSLQFLDKELFADLLPNARQEADVVVRAQVRDQPVCFIIHLEHQAQPQPDFPRRMFTYFARFHEKYREPIFPIVLFSHTGRRAEPGEYVVAWAGLEVLRFRFRVIQLSRLGWRDYVGRANPVASALMARMRMGAGERARVKLECLRVLVGLGLGRAQQRLISGFVDTYLPLSGAEELQFVRERDRFLSNDERGKMIELTTSWKEEGRREGEVKGLREGEAKGRLAGLREGEVKGRRDLVVRQLRRRLGRLSREREKEVRALSTAGLAELAEALLEFRSSEDLNAWLAAH